MVDLRNPFKFHPGDNSLLPSKELTYRLHLGCLGLFESWNLIPVICIRPGTLSQISYDRRELTRDKYSTFT